MRSMKKLLSSLLIAVLCMALIAVPVYAEGENEAKIGDTEYATLAEAVAVGGEITLLKDVSASEVIQLDKNVTIIGNGYTVTSSATRVFRVTVGGISVNMQGVNIVSTAGSGDTRGVSIDRGITGVQLTLSNCSISGASYAVNVVESASATIVISGGSYSGLHPINIKAGAASTITISGATINVTYPASTEWYGCGVCLEGNGHNLNVNGTTFSGNSAVAIYEQTPNGNTITVDAISDNTSATTVQVVGSYYYGSLKNTVEIGGNLKLTNSITVSENVTVPDGKSVCLDLNGKTLTIAEGGSISGSFTVVNGYVASEPSASWIPEGYAAVLIDGMYYVHQHNPVLVEAKEATCTVQGNTAHFKCEVCGLCYEDNNGAPGEEVPEDRLYEFASHALTYMSTPSTCTFQGYKECFFCSVCEKYFADETSEEEITDVRLPFAPHTTTKYAATPSTCYSHGTIEYYECNVCYKWFSDEACTTEVTSLDAPLAAHDMKEYPAKTATCAVPGNVLYYKCQDCGNFYLDVNGNQPTNLDAVVTTAEHSFEFREEVPATNTTHGCMEHNYCTSCRSYFYPNSSQPVEYEDLILHAWYFHDNVQTIGALKLNEEKKITVNSDTALYYSFTPETTGEYTFYTNNLEMNTPGVVIYTVLADGSGMMQFEPNYSGTPKYAGVGAYLNADQTYVVAVYGMENAGSLETVIGVCQPGGTATHAYFGREIEIFAKVYWGESLFGDPIGSVIRDCTVKSSDESILQVGFDPEFQMVNLYGLKAGTATVTVTTPAGNSTTCKVTVKPIPELAVGAPQTVAVKGWDGTVLSFTPKADGIYDLYVGKAAESLEFYVVDNKTGPAEGTELDEEGKFGFRYTLKGGVEYIIQAANPRDADVTTSVNVAMVSHTHNLTKTAAVASTCKEQGTVEYYTCAACSKIFADAQAKTEITDTKAALAAHTLTKVVAKDATYTDVGNVEYYSCSVCSKLFSDAEAKTETTLEKVTVPQMIEVVGSKAEVSEEAMDAAIEAAGTAGNVTLDLTKDEVVGEETAAVSSAVIPVASLEKVADAGASLTLTKADATVTMDAKALESIAKAAGTGTVTLVVQEVKTEELAVVQQNAVKDKKVAAVISAELINTATNENIGTEADGGFGGGTVTVQIPFTPEEGYKGTDYTVFYVADNGAVTEIKTEYKDGCLVVALNHFSEYVVVNTSYVKPSTGTNPATGDYGMVMPLAIMLLCGVAAAGLIIGKKKYNF